MQRLSCLPHSRKGGDLLWYLKQIKCYIYWFSKVSSDLLQVNGDQELGKKKKKKDLFLARSTAQHQKIVTRMQ